MQKEYSAGAVKHSFWFQEFKKIIVLLLSGNSMDEIKRMSQNENIFSAPTAARATQIFNTVSNRIKSLSPDFYTLFEQEDISPQKIINLISIMNTDTLFSEFTYEVYREKLILGDVQLLDSDVRVFFKNKQTQNERVAGWQDYTIKRLGNCYKTFLIEAGIVHRNEGKLNIVKPVFDIDLENCLIKNDMKTYLEALTGVRR